MNWSGTGFGVAFEVAFRELEHFARRFRHARTAPGDPEQDLPNVELPPREQQAALHREIARRRLRDGVS
jgi:hypothetical protein